MIACGLGRPPVAVANGNVFVFYLGSHSRVSIEFPSSGSWTFFGVHEAKGMRMVRGHGMLEDQLVR